MAQDQGRETLPRAVKQLEHDEYIKPRRKAAAASDPPPSGNGSKIDTAHGANQSSTGGSIPDPKVDDPTGPFNDLVGLALSGGGIRSATFSLGILQGLARRNVLRLSDYLSTVSGGGYIGSCLTSLMTSTTKKDENQVDHAPDWDADDFGLGPNDMPLLQAEHVHHLRSHGDFLLIRRGVVRREVMRTIGHVVTGTLCSLLMFALLQFALSGYFVASSSIFLGSEFWKNVRTHETSTDRSLEGTVELRTVPAGTTTRWDVDASFKEVSNSEGSPHESPGGPWPKIAQIIQDLKPNDPGPLLLLFVLGALFTPLAALGIAMIAWLGFWRPRAKTGETAEDRFQVRQLAGFSTLFILLGVALPLWLAWHFPPTDGDNSRSLAGLLFHPAFFIGSFCGAGFLYVVNAWTQGPWWTKQYRSLFGAIIGISIYANIFSVVVIAMTLTIWWAVSEGMAAWFAMGGAASTAVAWLLSQSDTDFSKSSSLLAFLRAVALYVALIAAVFVFFVSTSFLCSYAIIMLCPESISSCIAGAYVFGIAVSLFVVLGYLIDFNRISLHYFYRDRLSETYLQTATRTKEGLAYVRDSSDLKLTDLLQRNHVDNEDDRGNPCPYQLIIAALNLAGSRDLARKDRKSDYFTFSKYFVGSTTTGYVRTETYRDGKTKLSTATTISGAAFSSGMGFQTSKAQAFVTTLFNARLGYWLANPRTCDIRLLKKGASGGDGEHRGESSKCDKVIYWEEAQPARGWDEASRLMKFCRWVATWGGDYDGTLFWPWFLSREMFALTTSDCGLVNLSDGAHTGDNVGIYPLLQRRCRLIIACDGEADPQYGCGSLAAAIRQIYTDENVVVDIDLSELEPVSNSNKDSAYPPTVKRHFLIGRIDYPNIEEPGWLIYLKSSVTGQKLPAVVHSYAASHPYFPHETTVDQIFSDDQFEAYRALGEHVANTLLDDVESITDVKLKNGSLDTIRHQMTDYCQQKGPPQAER